MADLRERIEAEFKNIEGVDTEWIAGSEDRLNACHAGNLTVRPFEEVMKNLVAT